MSLSRREFCSALGAATLSTMTGAAWANGAQPQPVRVIAYNVYVCRGWPADRPLAQQAVARGQMGRRLAQELALHDPDIVVFSESPSQEITQEVAGLLDMRHVRFPSAGRWPGTLLSRFEIIESANVPIIGQERPADLFTRHWGRGTVRLPNGELLIVHSIHLMPQADNAPVRLREIRMILRSMQGDLDAGRSILLLGDANHLPDTPEHRLWLEAGFVDTFEKAGEGEGFTIRADRPERRIDYVFAAGPIAEGVVESRPLFEGAFRLNVADDRAFALSDHLPQLAVFR